MLTNTKNELELIGHLMRRAAFGVRTEELEALASTGYDAVVDDLLHPENNERPEEDLLERYHVQNSDEEQPHWTADQWMFRMVNSARPLEEKIALMWHGIFAVGYIKVLNNPMMKTYVLMMRDHGLGNFGDILKKLSRDPAMLYWLDQQMNHGEAVNENYGREMLELFSMGRGNYTEDDVKACARAFTGWTKTQTIPRYPTGFYNSSFVYRDEDHDHGEKTFLGETGNFNGDDIVDIIVKQPATAQFVATEIYNFFVSDNHDPEAVEVLARAYIECGYNIRDVLKVLFHSKFFKEARFEHVKSPAEPVAGTLRLSGDHTDPYDFGLSQTTYRTALMGQQLLNPPTVEGWHTGREWIDSSFLIERVNFAAEKLGNPNARGVIQIASRIASTSSSISPKELLDACLYELGAIEIETSTKDILLDELGIKDNVPCATEDDMVQFRNLVAQILGLVSATREYQMA